MFLELWPFEILSILKKRMKSFQQDISKSIWARVLKFGQLSINIWLNYASFPTLVSCFQVIFRGKHMLGA